MFSPWGIGHLSPVWKTVGLLAALKKHTFFCIMYCICRVIQNATMSSPFVIFQCVALSQSFNIEIDYHKASLVLEKSTDL